MLIQPKYHNKIALLCNNATQISTTITLYRHVVYVQMFTLYIFKAGNYKTSFSFLITLRTQLYDKTLYTPGSNRVKATGF